MIWFAIIYLVGYLLILCAGPTFGLPIIGYHVASILFIACTAILVLWAVYLDFKDANPGRKVAFILFGLIVTATLWLARYHPGIAQSLFN